MGPKDSYKCDLTNLLVPLIMLSLNHQNHKQWPKWGHVPYNLPLFGDWWQHSQSKHKICKNWQIEPLTLAWMLTIIQWWLGLPLKPLFPLCSFPYLLLLSHALTWSTRHFFPFGTYFFFLGTFLPLCWEHDLLWPTSLPLRNQIT